MSLELPLFRDSDTGINNMQEIWEKRNYQPCIKNKFNKHLPRLDILELTSSVHILHLMIIGTSFRCILHSIIMGSSLQNQNLQVCDMFILIYGRSSDGFKTLWASRLIMVVLQNLISDPVSQGHIMCFLRIWQFSQTKTKSCKNSACQVENLSVHLVIPLSVPWLHVISKFFIIQKCYHHWTLACTRILTAMQVTHNGTYFYGL